MERKGKKDSFWLSYSDLMTSLFFIMLVLFLICIMVVKPVSIDVSAVIRQNDSLRKALEIVKYSAKEFEDENKRLKVSYEQLQSLVQLEGQFKILSASSTLRYDEGKRTFIAKELEGIEIFREEDDRIKGEYEGKVTQVGKDLEKVLGELKEKNPDFRFLLVIEGTSANDVRKPMGKDREYNYNLSFSRALTLYNFWRERNIDLRKYNTEILICGSGLNGINRDDRNEANNKRFVIQILPKVTRPQKDNKK